jgi:transcriptional regulator with XRE-family HTH domain
MMIPGTLHPVLRPAVLFRRLLGSALRQVRISQRRTLREVSAVAGVSLGYLSEIERGRKEASSELLAAICAALGVRLADLLAEVVSELARLEPTPVPVIGTPPAVAAGAEVRAAA